DASTERADVLLIDAYDGQSLARAFTDDAFYARARAALAPSGVLVMNLWSSDRAFDRNLRRIEGAFEAQCLCLPAERPGNVIVLAFSEAPLRLRWTELRECAQSLSDLYGLDFDSFVRDLRKMNRHDAQGLQLDVLAART